MNSPLAGQVVNLATTTRDTLRDTPHADAADAILQRLSGPLRVAIAGRVKAGKSTLLNALVGERLAPTDTGECTRLVSSYRQGNNYQVNAILRSGERRELSFKRDGGALAVELGEIAERDVASLDIGWPTSTLQQLTLIDTPGLASVNDENSRRTRDFLDADDTNPTEADAVIYLMRHLHRSDVEFLDAYMDRSVTAASPVNAVAVLSRADEIGAGRLDAMASAARIADRYRQDPLVGGLAATVVPLAGLLAETGLTLQEAEAASLRELASTPAEVLDTMLLSTTTFCEMHASNLTVEVRRDLLARLGMFGVRVAAHEVRNGATTAAQLGPRLVEISGLGELRTVIAEHFMPRARVLQARTALGSLRGLAREVRRTQPDVSGQIDRSAEMIEASAVEFGQLRAAHLVAAGAVRVNDRERRDLQRLLLGGATPAALGLDVDARADAVRTAALQSVSRWRTKAADPLADHGLIEVAEAAIRTSESLYASATG